MVDGERAADKGDAAGGAVTAPPAISRLAALRALLREAGIDAALLLHLHPIRAGAATLALGFHRAGKLNGAAEEEELFCKSRLARVRMGDDRERAPASDFLS